MSGEREALLTARDCIAADRALMARCAGSDDIGLEAVAEYDAVLAQIDAALSAQPQREQAGEWVSVPRTPTEAMHQAAVRTILKCVGNDDFPPRVWRAMLAMAPTRPAAADPLTRRLVESTAVAQLVRDADCRVEWRVTLADGRVYLAYTYPDSLLICITNLDGRPVRGINIEPECRAAIAAATGVAGSRTP